MQSPQITLDLPLGQAPHTVRRLPCRAAASHFHIPVFHATFVPHAIPRPPHTRAASPYGIMVSPYNHTPDAFPHTFSADPPYNPQAPKNPTPNLERPAFRRRRSHANRSHEHPGPALPVLQIKRQPGPLRFPAPASHLRRSTIQPVYSNTPGSMGVSVRHRFAMRRRHRRRSRGLHSSPPEGGLRHGSPGSRGRPDPAKVRRCAVYP